jgi:hypothetical protein
MNIEVGGFVFTERKGRIALFFKKTEIFPFHNIKHDKEVVL